MKAQLTLTNPDEIEATIALTMTLAEFQRLREALKDAPFHGPAQALRGAIDNLVERATMRLGYVEPGHGG